MQQCPGRRQPKLWVGPEEKTNLHIGVTKDKEASLHAKQDKEEGKVECFSQRSQKGEVPKCLRLNVLMSWVTEVVNVSFKLSSSHGVLPRKQNSPKEFESGPSSIEKGWH